MQVSKGAEAETAGRQERNQPYAKQIWLWCQVTHQTFCWFYTRKHALVRVDACRRVTRGMKCVCLSTWVHTCLANELRLLSEASWFGCVGHCPSFETSVTCGTTDILGVIFLALEGELAAAYCRGYCGQEERGIYEKFSQGEIREMVEGDTLHPDLATLIKTRCGIRQPVTR